MFKGGRGNKAPYETTHVRVPVPLLKLVNALTQEWREACSNGVLSYDDTVTSLDPLLGGRPPNIYEAMELAQQIITQKKSAKVSLEKLLTAMYKENVTLSSNKNSP